MKLSTLCDGHECQYSKDVSMPEYRCVGKCQYSDTVANHDGGPAFPHQFEDVAGCPNWMQSEGMSLRDWFAGQAIGSLIAVTEHATRSKSLPYSEGVKMTATLAYDVADAMIAARKAGA